MITQKSGDDLQILTKLCLNFNPEQNIISGVNSRNSLSAHPQTRHPFSGSQSSCTTQLPLTNAAASSHGVGPSSTFTRRTSFESKAHHQLTSKPGVNHGHHPLSGHNLATPSTAHSATLSPSGSLVNHSHQSHHAAPAATGHRASHETPAAGEGSSSSSSASGVKKSGSFLTRMFA